METLSQKLRKLEIAVSVRIRAKIIDKGVESSHRSHKVLKVRDNQQFNLEGGRYLTEITDTRLIDNEGYEYFHSALELDKLCEAVDSI